MLSSKLQNGQQASGQIDRQSHMQLLKLLLLAACVMISLVNVCYAISIMGDRAADITENQQSALLAIAKDRPLRG